jgi:hypothetical protein
LLKAEWLPLRLLLALAMKITLPQTAKLWQNNALRKPFVIDEI